MLGNVFEGIKGRQPRSNQELNEWLASPEGKQARMFESTSLSRLGRDLTVLASPEALRRDISPAHAEETKHG